MAREAAGDGARRTSVPVAFLIHGGPQGSFGDHFHYRWNPEVFAGHGYAAVMIDFHGSTGYGQAFTDAIRGDWGGAPYEDLMKGLDAALAKYPFLDKRPHGRARRVLRRLHDQLDQRQDRPLQGPRLPRRQPRRDAWPTTQTEELWFPEWEHGGVPWENAGGLRRQSPMTLVKNWKTPTLVVHGGQDYRVVDTAGDGHVHGAAAEGDPLALPVLPRREPLGAEAAHSKRWHDEVLAWIDRFTRGGSPPNYGFNASPMRSNASAIRSNPSAMRSNQPAMRSNASATRSNPSAMRSNASAMRFNQPAMRSSAPATGSSPLEAIGGRSPHRYERTSARWVRWAARASLPTTCSTRSGSPARC